MGGRHAGMSLKQWEEGRRQMAQKGGKSTNVEHIKPLTYESSNDENYSNLYKVSGGGRRRGRRRIRKSLSKNVKRSYSKNKRRTKRRLSLRKRGGSKKK